MKPKNNDFNPSIDRVRWCSCHMQKRTKLQKQLLFHLPCNALNPCKGTRELPVTNCNSRALISLSYPSAACQNHFTMLLSGVQCFNLVCNFQSSRSILPRPPIINYKILMHMSQAMRKCVLCHMRTTKAQISLRIRVVWSAPLLFTAKTEWYL